MSQKKGKRKLKPLGKVVFGVFYLAIFAGVVFVASLFMNKTVTLYIPVDNGKSVETMDVKTEKVDFFNPNGFKLPELEYTNYTVDGWYIKDTKELIAGTAWIGSKSLEPKLAPKEFKIEYYNGPVKLTDAPYPKTYTYGTELDLKKYEFTKDMYTFTGWEDEEGNIITKIPADSTGPKKLTATLSANHFPIMYFLDGGELPEDSPSEYEYSVGIRTLPKPTKNNEDFGGWYRDLEFEEKVTSIGASTSGPVSLYAKWGLDDENGPSDKYLSVAGNNVDLSNGSTAPFESDGKVYLCIADETLFDILKNNNEIVIHENGEDKYMYKASTRQGYSYDNSLLTEDSTPVSELSDGWFVIYHYKSNDLADIEMIFWN